ncbi:HNH endonuclease [Paenibacillus naphthalenovorans]|uniref:HNH endonuclease n=1 Tax=Paenibacillus naphthalenovorans TaxID=162209 RepID=UPI003D277D58
MRNNYKIIDDVVLIRLNKLTDEYHVHAIVSLTDLPKLLTYDCIWGERKTEFGSYVTGYEVGSGRGSNKVSLHRFLTNCPQGMVVDHINGNGLDNRRVNMRVCTQLENMQNITKPGSGRYSKERGVSYHKSKNRWTGSFYSMKRRISIGYYQTEEEAIAAIRAAKLKHREVIVNG